MQFCLWYLKSQIGDKSFLLKVLKNKAAVFSRPLPYYFIHNIIF